MLVLAVLVSLNKMDINKLVEALIELRRHLSNGDYEINRVDGNPMRIVDYNILNSVTFVIDEQLEKFKKEKENGSL